MPTLGEVAQASKIWQVFSLAERDEKFGTISVIAWVSSVLGELSSWHDKRKWLSSPTPSLHSWQVLSIRGVLGDLYRPVSTSRGRHPMSMRAGLTYKGMSMHAGLTYKGMSMRAGLTYKGIACVLYQHT